MSAPMQDACSILENKVLPKTNADEPLFHAASVMQEIACGYGYGEHVELDRVAIHLYNLKRTPITVPEESEQKTLTRVCQIVEKELAPAVYSAKTDDVFINRAMENSLTIIGKLACTGFEQPPNIDNEIGVVQQFIEKEKASPHKR